jgi:arylsulfatase A-like enzyme
MRPIALGRLFRNGLGCCAAFLAAGALLARGQPNVIVILTDDMGWSDLGAQGVVRDIKTPNLDQLAASGVRCTAGYVTSPQCSPSRAAIITGNFQQRYGIDTIPDVPLPTSAVTLAERLGSAGYRCGFVGKWHLEPNVTSTAWMDRELPGMSAKPRNQRRIPLELILRYGPGAQGFQEYFWGEMKHYRANFSLDGRDLQPAGEAIALPQDFRIEVQTRAAVSFIERNHAKPFYLHVAYFGPHTPLEAPKKYLDRFSGPMPERRRYALAMIAAIDDGVGQIVAKLREHGLAHDTLIIYTSDNGAPLKMTKIDSPINLDAGGWDGSLNDPWIGEKGMLSEGGIRVPMIFAWPGTIPAGQVYEQPVSSLDFAATAIAVAGLPATPTLDGVNLLPFLTGQISSAPHQQLYWRFWDQAAIREGRWKYLSAGNGPHAEFLFDVTSDEHERKNRFAEQPGRAAALRSKLAAWARQFKPPGIPDKPQNGQETAWYRFYFPRN